jgi:hypothetical protein
VFGAESGRKVVRICQSELVEDLAKRLMFRQAQHDKIYLVEECGALLQLAQCFADARYHALDIFQR